MGFTDSVKNTSLAVTGRVKEVAGFAFKNENLQYEGKADQVTAHLRKAKSKSVDAVDSVRKAFTK
jgi:uncharacterized protein YjbJ (UPF0337 family)